MNTVIETKNAITLTKGEYLKLQFYLKLNRILARLKNKIEERKFEFLLRSGSEVALDKSKTEYKVKYGAILTPCEFVYADMLVATVIACDNPCKVNTEKLERLYPDAYADCVTKGGQHLRLNIKK